MGMISTRMPLRVSACAKSSDLKQTLLILARVALQRRQKDHIPLQAFRLMNGHDLDANAAACVSLRKKFRSKADASHPGARGAPAQAKRPHPTPGLSLDEWA